MARVVGRIVGSAGLLSSRIAIIGRKLAASRSCCPEMRTGRGRGGTSASFHATGHFFASSLLQAAVTREQTKSPPRLAQETLLHAAAAPREEREREMAFPRKCARKVQKRAETVLLKPSEPYRVLLFTLIAIPSLSLDFDICSSYRNKRSRSNKSFGPRVERTETTHRSILSLSTISSVVGWAGPSNEWGNGGYLCDRHSISDATAGWW